MTHGSLFSGIGGFDLAAQWMGWENIFHCEIAEFPRKILNKHFPNSISYADITKTDFTIHRGQIDIVTGGFPCQPFSMAGKRKGTEDERHLWPEMLRAISEIQPRWVLGENVYGIVNWDGGLVFDEVQTDLEAKGYEIQPVILPACSVGAPHKRDRTWFIAYSNGSMLQGAKDRLVKNGQVSKQTSNEISSYFYESENVGLGDYRGIRTNDGIPNRLDRIKSLGNAIVPEVAYLIFKTIMLYERANDQSNAKT